MTTPTLSIITVCFRVREQLLATMDNIFRQSWKDFEYVAVDGGSEDGTRELLETSGARFEKAGIPFRFVSEPDQGIYDAMNKGVQMASGKWLLFLNAGDLLSADDTLEQFFGTPSDADILYGDTRCVYEGRSGLYPALPLERLRFEMAFCHQSALIARELLLQQPYDTSYRVCADHHFFLSMYLQGKKFEYRPAVLSVYEIAGYSDRHPLRAHSEQLRMRRELGTFSFSPAELRRELLFYLKYGIKTLFGQRLVDWVRRRKLKAS